jgi:hypothetical protein
VRSLLETIERMIQPAYVVGASRVNEASGLATVDNLGELSMEECVLDIKLASLPFKGERDGEDEADHGRFDNQAECLVTVNAFLSRETAKHPTCFVAVERAIRI